MFFPYLLICFLIGGIYSFIKHRRDLIYYNKGLAILQVSNKKLAEMKKINVYSEKRLKIYLARGIALTENDKPTKREKWNRKEFEKLERKYRPKALVKP